MNVNDPQGDNVHSKAAATAHHAKPPNRIALIALALFLVAFFAVMVFKIASARPEKVEWRPVRSGGAVRLHSVTVGSSHSISLSEDSFGKKLQRSLSRMSLAPFFESSAVSRISAGSLSGLTVWLLFQDRRSRPVENPELTLPDGQVFRSYGSTTGSRGDGAYAAQIFQFVPYNAPKLHFTAKIDGEVMSWGFDNPGYRKDLVEWEPEPLPAKRTVGGYEFTLQSLQLRKTTSNSEELSLQPKTTITKDGKPAPGIMTHFAIRDVAGNEFYQTGFLSSKAWKLLPRFRRTNQFPFQEDEVKWIGEIDPATMPEPETITAFPVGEDLNNRGVLLAGVYGPGIYEYRGTELVRTKANPPANMGHHTTGHDYNTKIVTLQIGKPAFVVMTKGSNGVVFFRDGKNEPKGPKSSHTGYGGDNRTVELFSLDGGWTRVGVADNRLPGVKDDDVAILVSPPQKPE
jgi:hypothetical protein